MEADRHMTLYPAQLLWWTQQPVAHDGYDTTEIVLGVCYDQGAKKGVTNGAWKERGFATKHEKSILLYEARKRKGSETIKC